MAALGPWAQSSGRAAVSRTRVAYPSSVEHVETKYLDKHSSVLLAMKYRGENGFGGLVLQAVVARVDFNGNIRELASVEPFRS